MEKTLNDYRDMAYANATEKGFHDEDRGNPTYLMLTVSELSEAMEADRKGKFVDKSEKGMASEVLAYPQSENKIWSAWHTHFELYVKDTFEDELADAVIRIFDLAGKRGIDLKAHVDAKMRYNASRPRKHGKAY